MKKYIFLFAILLSLNIYSQKSNISVSGTGQTEYNVGNIDTLNFGTINGRDSSYFFGQNYLVAISSPESDDYLIDMYIDKRMHVDSICIATFDSTIHSVRVWWGTALDAMPNTLIADSAREILGDGVMNVTGKWFSGSNLTNKDIPIGSFIQIVTGGSAGVHQEKLFLKIRGWWY